MLINEPKQGGNGALGVGLVERNAEVMRGLGAGPVELGRRDVQNVVSGQDARATFHGLDVDGEVFGVGADEEVLPPVLAVGGAKGARRAGQVVAVGEDDLAERSREAHHAGLREAVFVLIPNIGDMVVSDGMVDQLAGKKFLLVADRDLNKRAVVQNNLLHANLMASKVSTKPIKMTENGT